MISFRLIALLGSAASLLSAANFYVAPNGSPSGDGSLGNPWDMQTALSQPSAVRPGDTIWLRGGTYLGPFTSSLSGTAAAPIVVRSYQGEWAKVDGAGMTTLTSNLPSSGNVSCSFADVRGIADGSMVQVGSEQLYLVNNAGNSFTCYRGWNGTPIAAHSSGSEALRLGNIVESTGSHVWWWGFEITSSRPLRRIDANYRGAGLNFAKTGVGNKAINMVIHNVGHPGVGFWDQGDGGEVYGSLIYNNGIYDPSFGNQSTLESMRRGSAIYAENRSGTVYISDVIAFRNLTNGLHLSATNAAVDNFTVTGNIVFDNSTGELFANGGDISPMKNLKMIGNYAYVRPNSGNNPARLGYGLHSDMVFQNNYIAGGANPAMLVQEWTTSINVSGNTVVGPDFFLGYKPNGAVATWDGNKYYGPFGNGFGYGTDSYTFAGWQSATGFDKSGSYSSAYPSTAAFVRPNKYETGRGNIVVFNWDMSPSVNVDLSSVLAPGATYEIRDAQNYFGAPIASGTYNGGTVSVPMGSTQVAPLVGDNPTLTNTHTSAQFGAFIVLSNSGAPSSPPPASADTTAPVISGVSATGISTSGVTLTWTTNEAADTQVYYGTSQAYGSSSALNSSRTTGHSATLSGLSADTTYNYQVRSRDAAGNLAVSANFTFRTAATATAPTASAPVISGVSVANVGSTSAYVTWTTDKPADTQVLYGPTTAYGSSTPLNTAMVTGHAVTLSGLSPNSDYSFQVRSKDSAGNVVASGNFAFHTAAAASEPAPAPEPTPAPASLELSNVRAANITGNAATILWNTNIAADSRVAYGRSLSYGASTVANGGMVTNHSMAVTGLRPNTVYYYQVQSRDAAGNLRLSGQYQLRTTSGSTSNSSDTTAPRIDGVTISNITSNSAVITWTTNEPSDSVVAFGTTTSYGKTASAAGMTTNHSVTLTGLTRITSYFFQVQSRDAAGNLAKGYNMSFGTAYN